MKEENESEFIILEVPIKFPKHLVTGKFDKEKFGKRLDSLLAKYNINL